MKKILLPLFILFVLVNKNSFSQDLNKLETIYQKILNNKRFIKATKRPVFNCDSITYITSGQDSILNLTFKNKKLYKYNEVGNNERPFLIFDTISKDNKTFVTIILRSNHQLKGRCTLSTSVEYTCFIKKKKKKFIIKKPKISTSTKTIMYM